MTKKTISRGRGKTSSKTRKNQANNSKLSYSRTGKKIHLALGRKEKYLYKKGTNMAQYGEKSKKTVKQAMHKMKSGKLKSGKSHKTVKNPKQAIAIGLSEARKKGAKVPKKS